MSELIITCCDICNTNQSTSGAGYIICPEDVAIEHFDWVKLSDGKITCIDCQEDMQDGKDDNV
mgnify:FL=1